MITVHNTHPRRCLRRFAHGSARPSKEQLCKTRAAVYRQFTQNRKNSPQEAQDDERGTWAAAEQLPGDLQDAQEPGMPDWSDADDADSSAPLRRYIIEADNCSVRQAAVEVVEVWMSRCGGC